MGAPVASPSVTDDPAVAAAPTRPGRHRLGLLLGLLTGLLGLVGMTRLATGAFDGGPLARFAWVVVLAAMLPWVVYAAWRGRHGRLSGRRLLVVAGLVVLGAATVWLAVLGPVLALACSLAAFVLIWVSDWPPRRPPSGDRFVRLEELQGEDEEEDRAVRG